MKVLLRTIWFISAVWAFLPLFASLAGCDLFLKSWYVYSILYGFYCSPIVIILLLYVVIIYNLWIQELRMRDHMNDNIKNVREKTNMNITFTTIIIGIFLIISYIPNIIWWHMDFTSNSRNIYPVFSAVSNILQVSNSAVNPMVYAVLRL